MSPARWLVIAVAALTLAAAAPAAGAPPTVTAEYVTMPDGTRIAVDVWRPAGLPPGTRVPTLVDMGRYRRSLEHAGGVEQDANFAYASAAADAGYAYVFADARGTGASFGTLDAELGATMIRDYGDLVDWIAAQPWSNGRVAATGVSYSGDTAIKLAALGRPALKAIAPLHYDFDAYEDLVYPGGLLIAPRLASYASLLRALDGIPGADCDFAALVGAPCDVVRQQLGQVKPVDGPDGPALRSAAQAEHVANVNLAEFADHAAFRDVRIGAASWRVVSIATDRRAIERSGVPIYPRTGWLDAGTPNGVLSQFTSLGNPQESWIGPWNHGAATDADPFKPARAPATPSEAEQFARVLAFLDPYLKRGEPARPRHRLHYYTFNEGRWRTTTRWPVAGTRSLRLYLRAGHTLARTPSGHGADVLRVEPRAGTGARDRWNTNLTGDDVVYPDRRKIDRRLVTYTTAPLERGLRVTGVGRISLRVMLRRGSGRGGLHAYLEHVAPGGRVTYVTEGQLAVNDRAIARSRPAWRRLRTPRTYARRDARPLRRGHSARLVFDLQPTSVRFRRGDRIRLAIAGANPDSFGLRAADRHAVYRVGRSASRPSHLTLPVIG